MANQLTWRLTMLDLLPTWSRLIESSLSLSRSPDLDKLDLHTF